MKVCILGASGKSGRRLVAMALARGHDVTAVVRDPVKLAGATQNNLVISPLPHFFGDALVGAMRGHDAVISAAGYISGATRYVELVSSVVGAAERALGEGGRFWLFGGAALLDVPGTSITTLDLPGVPKIYEPHRANFEKVGRTALDWSMLCPGPMIGAPDGMATENLIVSRDVWPVPRPAYTYLLPRVALSLAFKSAIPRMTIYYEDAAKVILDHLARNGPLSRKRVGVALSGERRHKAAEAPT
jgi:putative NADH-flavin reductase